MRSARALSVLVVAAACFGSMVAADVKPVVAAAAAAAAVAGVAPRDGDPVGGDLVTAQQDYLSPYSRSPLSRGGPPTSAAGSSFGPVGGFRENLGFANDQYAFRGFYPGFGSYNLGSSSSGNSGGAGFFGPFYRGYAEFLASLFGSRRRPTAAATPPYSGLFPNPYYQSGGGFGRY